jgi:hypothetical protein
MDPEEQRLIAAAEQAQAAHNDGQIARTNDELNMYYSARNEWELAEKAGYKAWRAAEHTTDIPFAEQLWMTYRLACALEQNHKVTQASMTYFNVANRLLDAPKDLRQLCCLKEANVALKQGMILRADRHFRKGLEFGTAAGFGTLQELRFEYAQFLMRYPEVRELAKEHVKFRFSRDKYDEEDVVPTTETPQHLLEQVIAAGTHDREDEIRVNFAKQLLAKIKQ